MDIEEEDEEYEYEDYPEDDEDEEQLQDADDEQEDHHNDGAKQAANNALEAGKYAPNSSSMNGNRNGSFDGGVKAGSSYDSSRMHVVGDYGDRKPTPDYAHTSSGDETSSGKARSGSFGLSASPASSSGVIPRHGGGGSKDIQSPTDGSYLLTEYVSIYPRLQALIVDVCSLLDVCTDVAQILLQMFRWDKEKLIDQFFGNSEKVLDESGMRLFCPEILTSKSFVRRNHVWCNVDLVLQCIHSAIESGQLSPKFYPATMPQSTTFACRICFDDSCDVHNNSVCVGCGHLFCRDCYTEYVRTQIQDGPSCIIMRCPQHKCHEKISMSVVKLLLLGPADSSGSGASPGIAAVSASSEANSGSPRNSSYGGPLSLSNREIYDKYIMFLTRNYIETSRTMRYCPSPNCNKVAIIGESLLHSMT
jgi:hypothetical protein